MAVTTLPYMQSSATDGVPASTGTSGTTGSGAMTAAQAAAIQAAVQQAISQTGGNSTSATYGDNLEQDLSGTGAFDASQLSALDDSSFLDNLTSSSDGYQNVGGGNTSAFTSEGTSALDQALSQAATNDSPTAISQSAYGTPAQVASAQPLPYSAFGSIPQVSPTYTAPATASTVNDPLAYGGMDQSTINQYENAVQQSLDPTFAQQQSQLEQQEAASGIFNSSANSQNLTNLQGQQGATLAGAYAPIISSAQTGQQQALSQNAAAGNTTNLANAGAATTANTFNATAANDATAANAATQLGITQSDENNYNSFENTLLGLGATQGGNVYENYLSSLNPQAVTAGATSTLGQGATNATNAATNAGNNTNTGGLSSSIANVFSGLGNGGGSSSSGIGSFSDSDITAAAGDNEAALG